MKEKRIKTLWILCSTSAIVLLVLYAISDFIIPNDIHHVQAIIFLVLGIISILLSVAAIFKARTGLKLVAVFNIVLGLLLVFWTYFVLTFTFTF